MSSRVSLEEGGSRVEVSPGASTEARAGGERRHSAAIFEDGLQEWSQTLAANKGKEAFCAQISRRSQPRGCIPDF